MGLKIIHRLLSVLIVVFHLNKLIMIFYTLFFRGVICVSYIKTAVKNVKYHRGVPCTPLVINQGGGKKSGGWEAEGGLSHPPDFDRGVAPPPWTPLETAPGLLTDSPANLCDLCIL